MVEHWSNKPTVAGSSPVVTIFVFSKGAEFLNPNHKSFKLFHFLVAVNVINLVSYQSLIGWPSGLRRQFKALVSSEARVRISSQTLHVVA